MLPHPQSTKLRERGGERVHYHYALVEMEFERKVII